MVSKRPLFLLFLVLILGTLASPAVFAQQNMQINFLEPIIGIFKPILGLFNGISSMSSSELEGMTRFLIWIAIFALVYAAANMTIKGLGNGPVIAFAFVFATISAMFMPSSLVLQVGGSWGQVATLILIGPILAAVLYGIIAWWGESPPFKALACAFLLFYMLAYFNALFLVSNSGPGGLARVPAMNLGGLPIYGILGVVFQVGSSIAAILLLILIVRCIAGIFSGGGGGGNTTTGNATINNPFRGLGGGGRDDRRDDQVGGNTNLADPRGNQVNADVAAVQADLERTQAEIRSINRALSAPGLSDDEITRLGQQLINQTTQLEELIAKVQFIRIMADDLVTLERGIATTKKDLYNTLRTLYGALKNRAGLIDREIIDLRKEIKDDQLFNEHLKKLEDFLESVSVTATKTDEDIKKLSK